MKLYTRNKDSFEEQNIPVGWIIFCFILLLVGTILLNGAITHNVTKDNTTTIVKTEVVYGECNTLDLRREFMYDKYKESNKEAFYYTTRSVSSIVSIPHEWLIFMLWQESRFKTNATNPYASATGIGQMTKAACKAAGVNYTQYKNADVHHQLLSVGKYLKLKKGGFKSYGELYLYLYLPAYVNKPSNFRIPQKYLNVNPGYSKYKTVGQFKAGVTRKFQQELKKY